MTDHLNGFIVTLKQEMREDDAEAIRQALSMIRGVRELPDARSSHNQTPRQERDHLMSNDKTTLRKPKEMKILPKCRRGDHFH